jgi:proline iminopeptidase
MGVELFITTPTLVMCGKYEAQCPLPFSEEIHRMIPASRLHIFEDSNHSPHIEEPEVVRCVVQTFLNTVFGGNDDNR